MHVHCKVPYNYVPVPSDLFFANYETLPLPLNVFFFFFNDTATTEIYTLSLHDALPISRTGTGGRIEITGPVLFSGYRLRPDLDRKSTRLNSSHLVISYAVFCLKKKKRASQALSGSSCPGSRIFSSRRSSTASTHRPILS